MQLDKLNQLTFGDWTFLSDLLDKDSVIYSFGIGREIQFDLGVIGEVGCQVFAFDPSPGVSEFLRSLLPPDNFYAFPYGVAGFDGKRQFHHRCAENYSLIPGHRATRGVDCQFYRLKTFMEALGHFHLDILKIDIEGAEYEVLRDMVDCKIFPKQLLVEFHEVRAGKTEDDTEELCEDLINAGYRVFNDETGHWGFVFEPTKKRKQ